jgi:6-phosphogluconate dehydrogenase
MEIGFVGLGKMGLNMVKRLLADGHRVVAFDLSAQAVAEAKEAGAVPASTLEELAASLLAERKAVWLMVPAGDIVDKSLAKVSALLPQGSILIDGGNSFWRDSQRRHAEMQDKGMSFIDCGTSGGVWGLANGYCLMYGGSQDAAAYLEPVFESLAPGSAHYYCGKPGSGHLVKMVHNGIEYGMMQSYAEGFEILEKSGFGFDLQRISNLWMHGSVVRSWLLELIENALADDEKLSKIGDYVADSGEARWTVQTAMDFDVPAHAITASLYTRFQSRQDESFAMKLVAAMRNQFGGHAVKKK